MNKELILFIINHEMGPRRIISDFIRQMIRNDEIPAQVKLYELPSTKEAQNIFEMLFKTEGRPKWTYKDEPIIPLPGFQRSAIAICDMEMAPTGTVELFRLCAADEVLREISFIMMVNEPDIGLISELGEMGIYHILVKPLTLENFCATVLTVARKIHGDEHYYYWEAERLLYRGEYAKALELMEEVESKYFSLKWTILRGKAYLGLDETQKAAANFTQVETGAHVASVIALKHLVEVYEAVGDKEKTIESLSKLTQKSPKNTDRKLKLAELYTEDNRPEEAKEILDQVAKDKLISTEIKMRIASLFEKAGFVTEAANLEMGILEGNLDDYIFCNNMAIKFRKQGRYESAEESYRKILQAHPAEAVIWFNRGVNLGSWGRTKGDTRMLREALDCFRRALKLNPDLTDADEALIKLKSDMRFRRKIS